MHGEFREWHENIGLNKDFASKAIKVSEQLIGNVETFRHLGLTALDMIATLPEVERTEEHTTSTGEAKTPDEMTVKELRYLKKQLKQCDEEKSHLESQLEQAQRSESIARKQLEE
ncbi:pathogenicity island protein [Staphylococcus sp. HMSC068H12]|nr:pathogenicity island protein [Staphylococcus saprophyticus]OEK23996.1 pathogenicity island protein [Staphylococcus saprophyticus]OFK27142.1 pathogenicity island protein [Staphylococcus sp. HMSC068H12]